MKVLLSIACLLCLASCVTRRSEFPELTGEQAAARKKAFELMNP